MNTKNIVRAILLIFLIRFALAMLPSFQVDMGAWLGWAIRLAGIGPANFYSDTEWTQYTPGFLYWLLIVGKLGWIHPMAIKIPAIIADMLTGYLIWRVVGKVNRRYANFSYWLYVLSPVAIIDGSVWGQIDGILTFVMFLTTYLLIEKKSCYWSFVLAALAFLIKPQAIAIFPVLLIITIIRFGILKTMTSSLIGVLVVLVGFYPFFPTNPVAGAWELIYKMGLSYPYTSLFAFNFWAYLGMWKLDDALWLGISYFEWGTIMMSLAFVALIVKYRQYFARGNEVYLVFALSCFIFFLFPTRVHERYLFPMFAYLIAYAGLKQLKLLFLITMIAIVVYSLNLYLPYSYYEQATNPLKNVLLENVIQRLTLSIASIQMTIFGVLWLFPTRNKAKDGIPIDVRHRKAIEQGTD